MKGGACWFNQKGCLDRNTKYLSILCAQIKNNNPKRLLGEENQQGNLQESD